MSIKFNQETYVALAVWHALIGSIWWYWLVGTDKRVRDEFAGPYGIGQVTGFILRTCWRCCQGPEAVQSVAYLSARLAHR